MKMMTKEIERALAKYPIYSQEGKKGDAKLIVEYFLPGTGATWYVTEGNPIRDENGNDTGDWEFFGLVHVLEWEWGYFTLSQILEASAPVRVQSGERVMVLGSIPAEREMYTPVAKLTLSEVLRFDDCPRELLEVREKVSEAVTVDASAAAQAETVTVEWTPAGAGQQVLF